MPGKLYNFALAVLVPTWIMLIPCSDEAIGADEAGETVPSEIAPLFDYLKAGSYKQLAAKESQPHESAGPHLSPGLPVRVYLNAALDTSLRTGAGEHPAGAAAIKEMFSAEGKLQGWSVSVKTAPGSAEGQGWFWVEFTSTTDPSKIAASGKGAPICVGCHSTGQDFVLSSYPLQ